MLAPRRLEGAEQRNTRNVESGHATAADIAKDCPLLRGSEGIIITSWTLGGIREAPGEPGDFETVKRLQQRSGTDTFPADWRTDEGKPGSLRSTDQNARNDRGTRIPTGQISDSSWICDQTGPLRRLRGKSHVCECLRGSDVGSLTRHVALDCRVNF